VFLAHLKDALFLRTLENHHAIAQENHVSHREN
jgi:hypothetical protein